MLIISLELTIFDCDDDTNIHKNDGTNDTSNGLFLELISSNNIKYAFINFGRSHVILTKIF